MKRILILTVGYGEGHNAAARSLAAGITDIGGADVAVEVLDLFEKTYGKRQDLSKKIYLGMINQSPLLWAFVYWLLDRTPLLNWIVLPSLFSLKRTLIRTLQEKNPDVVVSTYPVYARLFDKLPRAVVTFKQYTLVTDSITVNRAWISKTTDGYFVPNADTAAVVKGFGVAADKVHVLGFPVPLLFADARPVRPDPNPPRVLFMVNYDKERAPLLVEKLLTSIPGLHLTVTVGRDETLRQRVETAAAKSGKSVEIHGWTNQMPQLLMTHHILIGKAGGAATQEAISAATPFIITQIVPGQELGNAQLIENHRCGAVCTTHDKIVSTIQRVFANHAAEWSEWAKAMQALSSPDSARTTARFVLANAGKK